MRTMIPMEVGNGRAWNLFLKCRYLEITSTLFHYLDSYVLHNYPFFMITYLLVISSSLFLLMMPREHFLRLILQFSDENYDFYRSQGRLCLQFFFFSFLLPWDHKLIIFLSQFLFSIIILWSWGNNSFFSITNYLSFSNLPFVFFCFILIYFKIFGRYHVNVV